MLAKPEAAGFLIADISGYTSFLGGVELDPAHDIIADVMDTVGPRPGLRPKWRGADEVRETAAGGRRGVGTTNHCMHGAHAIIEEVIDWRPFDCLTLTTLLPMPDAPKVLMTYAFSEVACPAGAGAGTHVEIRVGKPKPKDTAFLEQVGAQFHQTITSEVATLRQMLEGQAAPAAIEEPALPASAERFRTQPVNAP